MSPDGNTSPKNEPLQFDVGESSTSSGTRFRRVVKATALGTLAALAGSLLYFAVAAMTGREFGLVAIAVGFMVGTAVRRGSGGRRGWAYQTLAIALTYLAIVSTYVPMVVKEFQKDAARSAARSQVAAPVPMDTITISSRGPTSADSSAPVLRAGAPQPTRRAASSHLGPGTVLLGIGAIVLLAAIVPIAAGLSNLIGLLIIGIALGASWAAFTMKPRSRADLRAVGYVVALTGALRLLAALSSAPI